MNTLTENQEIKLSEIAVNFHMPRSSLLNFMINFFYMVSKVPNYSLAFIDKKGKVVKPVDIEDI